MKDCSFAPWTDDEVTCLQRWQDCDYVHPFTSTDGSVLIPTREGWVKEPGGPIVQDWAHTFMVTFQGSTWPGFV